MTLRSRTALSGRCATVSNLGAAIVRFAQIVGSANIPGAIAGLHLLTDAVHELTNLAAKIPTAAQIADNPVAHFNEAAGAAIWDAIKRFDNAIHGKALGGAEAAPVTSNVKVVSSSTPNSSPRA